MASRGDTTDHRPFGEVLCAAVPSALHPFALEAATAFDAPSHPALGVRSAWVDGEQVSLPYRIYTPDVRVEMVVGLSPPARRIAHAALTRHHDGYVRERHLKEIIGSGDGCVLPFVITPLGEYVIEIHSLIERELGALLEKGEFARGTYRSFVTANPDLMAVTRQRAISYWDRYHRGDYPPSRPGHAGHASSTYPAFAVLDRLESL